MVSNAHVSRCRRILRASRTILICISVLGVSLVCDLGRAYADVPAVTDFTANHVHTAFGHENHTTHALFITFYEDGRHESCIREVSSDAIAGFANGRSAWRLDGGLMWYMQMPVYVREVRASQLQPENESV